MIVFICTFLVLVLGTYTDIKKREIPLYTSILLFFFSFIFRTVCKVEMGDYLLGMFVGFLSSLPLFFTKIGGGDIILNIVIGFILGLNCFVVFLIILDIILMGYARKHHMKLSEPIEVPMVPFFLSSYCVILIIMSVRYFL